MDQALSLDRLLAAPAGAALPLDAERVLWRSEDGSLQVALEPREMLALEQCREFRTSEQHAAVIAAASGLGASRAMRICEELRARGLLISPAERLAAAERVRAPVPDPLLCVRTCSRPDTLRRLLDSLHRYEAGLGLRRRVLVIDDGTDEAICAATRAAVASFARARGGAVSLLGHAERPALRDWLHAADAEATQPAFAALLDPALPSGRGGARAWNLALLAAAGRALSIVDDDIVFDPRRPPHGDDGIELLDTIASETGLLERGAPDSLSRWCGDLIGALAAQVGCSPGALADPARLDPAGLLGRTHADLEVLRPGTRVLAAFSGVYGALAFDSSVYLNTDAPRRAPELLAEPFDLARFEADRIWHGIRRDRLLTHAVYTPLVLDARELLPFAGTWGKADDTLFLALLSAIVPRPAYLYSPALLGHQPPEPRHRLANSLKPLLIDRSAIVAGLIDAYATALRGNDRSLRLQAVGGYCADLATATEPELRDLIVRGMQTQYAQLIERLVRTLAEARTAPQAWIEHVGAIIRAQRAAIADPPGLDDTVPVVRAALAQLGTGAALWPRVWAQALTLPLLETVAVNFD